MGVAVRVIAKFKEIINSPAAMVKFHAFSVVFWMIMIPVSHFTGLSESVPFLNLISLWALVAAHWAGFQGAHAERSSSS